MNTLRMILVAMLLASCSTLVQGQVPFWDSGSGASYQPVAWPTAPSDPAQCGDTCGEWLPYTRFGSTINDPRTQDPSNGGTSPQNYVNIASSCTDTGKLIIQLMTPWQALHLGMLEASSGESTHAHCATSSLGQPTTHQVMNHNNDVSATLAEDDLHSETTSPESLSDTCERACGLALSEPVIITLRPMVSGSTVIHARDTLLNPLFLKVPNPPPIA